MSEFKKYRMATAVEIREIEKFEVERFKETGVLVFYQDKDHENKVPYPIRISLDNLTAGCPKLGDMIARSSDGTEQWLISKEFFEQNYMQDISKIEYPNEDCRNMQRKSDNIITEEAGPFPDTSFVTEMESEGFDFGHAIAAAKMGKKVARKGWNGSGMFAYIVQGGRYPSETEIAKNFFGPYTPYRKYWALKTAQGDVATWAPSGSDSLAEDWIILD